MLYGNYWSDMGGGKGGCNVPPQNFLLVVAESTDVLLFQSDRVLKRIKKCFFGFYIYLSFSYFTLKIRRMPLWLHHHLALEWTHKHSNNDPYQDEGLQH